MRTPLGQAPLRTIAVAIAVVVFAALLIAGRPSSYVTLVPAGGFHVNGEYFTTSPVNVRSTRFGSWSGSDAHTGTLTSAPFHTGAGIALAVSGYPTHAGINVRIERTDGNGTYTLPLPDAGEHWTQLTIPLPLEWVGRSVRLVATDNATAITGWVGIADVRRPGIWTTLLADARIATFFFALVAALMMLPCYGLAERVCLQLQLREICIFPLALIVAGCVAEAAFFLTMLNTMLAAVATDACILAGSVYTISCWRRQGGLDIVRRADAWLPFAACLACLTVYLAVFAITMTPQTPVMSLTPLLQLPIDNQLPYLLADQVASHTGPRPFVGDWLSSDRPPLQAGFDLVSRAALPWIASSLERYEGLGMWLQSTALGMMFVLCRLCGLRTARSAVVVAFAVFSGFFLINTVFVWPKLLATAMLATAAALAMANGPITRGRSALIGVGAGLGLLSHAGIAFTIPALVITLVAFQRRRSFAILGAAALALLVVLLPWSWYQHFYDPPGDRLLKWHLAGHEPPTTDSLSTLLERAYLRTPAATIVQNKIDNFTTVAGGPYPNNPLPPYGNEFFFMRDAVGILVWPALLALGLFRISRFRTASRIAWIAFTSTIFWCLAMYEPYAASVHQGSYFTMMLVFITGAVIATEWWPLAAVLFCAQMLDFITTWIQPAARWSLGTATGATLVAAIGIVIAALLTAAARSGRRYFRRNRQIESV